MSKYKNNEVPGDARFSQALFDREVHRCGMAVYKLQRRIETLRDDEIYVKAIRIKFSEYEGGEVMAVVTANMQSGPFVAFHGGGSLKEVLAGLSARMENGSLKWKEDQYG